METGRSRSESESEVELSLQNRVAEKRTAREKFGVLKKEFDTRGISLEVIRLSQRLYLENNKTIGGIFFKKSIKEDALEANAFLKNLLSNMRDAFVAERTDETQKKLAAIPLDEYLRSSDLNRQRRNTPNYDAFIDYNETLTNAIKFDILFSDSLEEALFKIKEWIKIMVELIRKGNFLDAHNVFSSLDDPSILKLIGGEDATNLDLELQEILINTREIFLPVNSFFNLKKVAANTPGAISPIFLLTKEITFLVAGDDSVVNNFINKFEYFNTIYQFLIENKVSEQDILSLFTNIKANSSMEVIFNDLLTAIPKWQQTHSINENSISPLIELIKDFKIMEENIDAVSEEERGKLQKQKYETSKKLNIHKIDFPLNKFMDWLNEGLLTKNSFNFTKQQIENKLAELIGEKNKINGDVIKFVTNVFINQEHAEGFTTRREKLKKMLPQFTSKKSKSAVENNAWEKLENYVKQSQMTIFAGKEASIGKVTKEVNTKQEAMGEWFYQRAVVISKKPKISTPKKPSLTHHKVSYKQITPDGEVKLLKKRENDAQLEADKDNKAPKLSVPTKTYTNIQFKKPKHTVIMRAKGGVEKIFTKNLKRWSYEPMSSDKEQLPKRAKDETDLTASRIRQAKRQESYLELLKKDPIPDPRNDSSSEPTTDGSSSVYEFQKKTSSEEKSTFTIDEKRKMVEDTKKISTNSQSRSPNFGYISGNVLRSMYDEQPTFTIDEKRKMVEDTKKISTNSQSRAPNYGYISGSVLRSMHHDQKRSSPPQQSSSSSEENNPTFQYSSSSEAEQTIKEKQKKLNEEAVNLKNNPNKVQNFRDVSSKTNSHPQKKSLPPIQRSISSESGYSASDEENNVSLKTSSKVTIFTESKKDEPAKKTAVRPKLKRQEHFLYSKVELAKISPASSDLDEKLKTTKSNK